MNGNYHLNKWKHKFKEKKRFVLIVAVFLWLVNWDIASGFFDVQRNLVVNPTETDVIGDIIKLFAGNKKFNSVNVFNEDIMFIVKVAYWILSFIAFRGIGGYLYEFFIKRQTFSYEDVKEDHIIVPKFPYDQDKLQLVIGLKHKEDNDSLVEHPTWVVVPEKGLYQDFLICGGKGTGKTQSCMYPFTKQMIFYKAYEPDEKAGMLILDVKGNYTKEAMKCADAVNRNDDVIVINLSGKYRYNPLHKPSLKTQVIANRLRTILELFSTQHADSYWLDKAEVLLNESIKLVRLYNKGYVTFVEIHKVVNNDDYLSEKIEYMQEIEDRNKLTRDQKAAFRTVKDYFLNEYKTLDTKISSVIKSEVTRMTYTFVSDPQILNTFCAPQDKLNFFGFDDLVDTGKVVVLDMNIAEFRNLSKIIAAYLKLDFQSAALIRITREGANTTRPLIFVSDEYQEYVTASDADFYAVSREAKCVNIVSSQSYSSLLKTLKSEETLQTILTNLTNKIWLRTDDKKTAEAAVAQCGVIEREDVSKSFNENAKLGYSYVMGRNKKSDATFGETLSVSVKSLDKFKVTTFTVKLPIFKAVAYLSDGSKVMNPTMIHLEPYFEEIYTNLKGRPAPQGSKQVRVPTFESKAAAQDDDLDIEDNYDFEAHKVISTKEKEDNKLDEKEDIELEEIEEKATDEISFDNEAESLDTDDFFDDDLFGESSKPKKKESKEDTFVPNYLDKETEESLKGIEGIFDED